LGLELTLAVSQFIIPFSMSAMQSRLIRTVPRSPEVDIEAGKMLHTMELGLAIVTQGHRRRRDAAGRQRLDGETNVGGIAFTEHWMIT
jgi:hypothetical protein